MDFWLIQCDSYSVDLNVILKNLFWLMSDVSYLPHWQDLVIWVSFVLKLCLSYLLCQVCYQVYKIIDLTLLIGNKRETATVNPNSEM